ncbi:MAG: hypothetical protein JWL88_264 [Parcubacteria group bacterium]|nr:hypothetical protein [Parcubacteria group bacterium]
MSKNAKIATAVAVVLVLGGLGYYWYSDEIKAPTASATFVDTPATLPSGTDTSDQSLQTDTAAIDAQMKGLSADQATMSSTVNASGQAQ